MSSSNGFVHFANKSNKHPKARAAFNTRTHVLSVICQCGHQTMTSQNGTDTPGFLRFDCTCCGRTWTAILSIEVAHGHVI